MTKDIIDTIYGFCEAVKDDRTPESAFEWGVGEMEELREELKAEQAGLPAGDDGVLGEGVDVILCIVDVLYQKGYTKAQIEAAVQRKCEKWFRKCSKTATVV